MKKVEGFTVVELLVTMIVGTVLLFSAYQLYTYILDRSSDARLEAVASNMAYRFMRENSAQAVNPCVAKTVSPAPVIPSDANLPNATAAVVITCPNIGSNSLSLVTSSVSYGSPQKTITHATYVKP